MIRTARLLTRPARYLTGLVLPHQYLLCRHFVDNTDLCTKCWSGLASIGASICEHSRRRSKCKECRCDVHLGVFLTCFVLHFYLLASRTRIDDEYLSYDTNLQKSTLIDW